MLTIERNQIILNTLEEKSAVSVSELSQNLNVSEVTVRKMLNNMARQGLLRRTRGGAVSLSVAVREVDVQTKEKANISKKREIAKKAYELINEYESIYLDAGTTTLELVRLIKNGRKQNLTIITNALNIATELLDSQDLQIILTGGQVRHGVLSCVGPVATGAVASFIFDKAFIGANSVDLRNGAATPNLLEAEIKCQAAKAAVKSYLLCDSSKFSGSTMAKIRPVESFTSIITDNGLSKSIYQDFLDAGINILLAGNKDTTASEI